LPERLTMAGWLGLTDLHDSRRLAGDLGTWPSACSTRGVRPRNTLLLAFEPYTWLSVVGNADKTTVG
jgi:hypothetical protein